MNAPMRHRQGGVGAGVLALGRLKTGEMNKTEAAYARHLDGLKAAGTILDFWFERVKLQLAGLCSYTPDFMVMRADGAIEMHEVKGGPGVFRDDARVKVRVAADTFPFRFIVLYPAPKKDGGGWLVEEF